MANAKTKKRSGAARRTRAGSKKVTTGRLRARPMTSARMAEVQEHVASVREAMDAAVARGEKLRLAIEKRIDRELKQVTSRRGKPAKTRKSSRA